MNSLKEENEILLSIYKNLLTENMGYRSTLKMPSIDTKIGFVGGDDAVNEGLLGEIRKLIKDNILCKELILNNS